LVGSSNLPPFLVCEDWRFFISGFALVSQPKNRPRRLARAKLKDQSLKKIRSSVVAGLLALSLAPAWAVTITENFVGDPLQNGWKTFGNSNLFVWNATNQNIEVTWDSTKQNSYLARSLGTVLTRDDAFSLSFELQLNDAVAFNWGHELAVGLFRWSDATNATFSRAGGNSPNLIEFDYFPDTGFGDSINATLKDFQPGYDGVFARYVNLTLQSGVVYQVVLDHAAGTTNLTGQIFTNGVLFTDLPLSYASFNAAIDFRVDTLSLSSYQDDGFGNTILAHGVVDNFTVTLPPPPVLNFAGSFLGGQWQCVFTSRTNWLYALERSTNLMNWTAVISDSPGVNGTKLLSDTNSMMAQAFYRIRAERP
jgi:hypothetical protein